MKRKNMQGRAGVAPAKRTSAGGLGVSPAGRGILSNGVGFLSGGAGPAGGVGPVGGVGILPANFRVSRVAKPVGPRSLTVAALISAKPVGPRSLTVAALISAKPVGPRSITAAALIVLLLFAGSPARAQNIPDQPADYIVDLANVIDASVEQRLNGYLQELERKTQAQLLALTVASTGDTSIEDFALRTAERWKLGQAGQSNGMLLVVAVQDRKYRFEVGYGLEPVLTDQYVGRLGREFLVPHFRRGDYGGGVQQAVLAAANRVAAEHNVQVEGLPPVRLGTGGGGQMPTDAVPGCFGVCWSIVPLLFLLAIFSGVSRRRQGRYGGYRRGGGLMGVLPWLILASQMGGRSRGGWGGGSWGGGGGFGGGGFGGGSFGGGGGGGFGGGGASGSW